MGSIEALTLFSIGHSNRPLADFLTLAGAHGLGAIVDVRAFPASRRWPHFNRGPLATALTERGIRYEWMPGLGGRRTKGRAESPHTAWTVAAFRNYADYAEGAEFAAALADLCRVGAEAATAFMCAEALHWQCHRRLIADHLLLAGHHVLHIDGPQRVAEHRLPPFARVVKGRLIYDGQTQLGLLD